MPAPTLNGKQRRFLRSLGHHLSPVVMVGKEGATGPVGVALDRALADHELVKVRLLDTCPIDRHEAAAALGKAAGAAVAGTLGRTILFFRPHAEKPRIELPAAGKDR
jgi:RNA-binding protein